MIRYLLILLLLPSVICAQNQPLEIYDIKTDHSVIVYAKNHELFPFTVTLDIKYEGLKPEEALPKYVVVPGKGDKVVIAKFIIPYNTGWKISYNFQFMEGDVNAKHDEDYVYQLPFEKGKSYSMTQGYNGQFTHQGLNALDFTMPKGETVVAARAGTVVKIKEDSNRGCPSIKCATYGNFVRILHSDGTMAEYYHLQKNGAIVNPGDIVKQGQAIGKGGETGYVSGPHLHFLVFKTDGTQQITFKTKFEFAPGQVGFLEKGARYSAFK